MKKRFLALILAGVLALSSCGNKQAETTTTEAAATSASVEAEATTAATEAEATTAAPEAGETTQAESTTDGENAPSPAVWLVTDPESGNSMKMMGTIHIVPESEKLVPDYVMDIYNECDSVAVEYDISKVQTDMVIQIKYLSYFLLNDGTLITDHISAEAYEQAKAYLTELGYYNETFDSYNAAYWENLLSSASILTIEGMKDTGIDTYFIGLAKQDGKKVLNIEALEDQMNAITATTDRLSEFNILEFMKLEEGEFEESFMALYNIWASGDVDAYLELEGEGMEDYPEEILADYEVYNEAMLTTRNIGMAERAKEYLKNGENVFYMVGFAHFCGEGSVIDLLEKDGYTVERIH